jgi:hypothetical protein
MRADANPSRRIILRHKQQLAKATNQARENPTLGSVQHGITVQSSLFKLFYLCYVKLQSELLYITQSNHLHSSYEAMRPTFILVTRPVIWLNIYPFQVETHECRPWIMPNAMDEPPSSRNDKAPNKNNAIVVHARSIEGRRVC